MSIVNQQKGASCSMTYLGFPPVQCGVFYYPSVLEESESIKKIRRNALINHLFTFNINLSSSFFREDKAIPFFSKIVRDLTRPEDHQFVPTIMKWLHKI